MQPVHARFHGLHPWPEVERLRTLTGGAYCGYGNVLSALAGHALAEMALGRTAPRIVGLLERLRSAPKS